MTNIYTVRDDKADTYLPPFYMRTDAEALRAFTAAANDQEHNFNKYAGDFHLFKLGTFDDRTGKLEPLDAPKHLVCAIDMRNKPAVEEVPITNTPVHSYNEANYKTHSGNGRVEPKNIG